MFPKPRLTDIDPRDEEGRKIPSLLRAHVREGDHVQLLLPAASGCVDGEQDRPSDTATDEAHGGREFDVAEKQVGIEGVMLQHVGVRQPVHRRNPVEEASGSRRRPFRFRKSAQVGSRHVGVAIPFAQDDEAECERPGCDQRWNQRGDQGRDGGSLFTLRRLVLLQ